MRIRGIFKGEETNIRSQQTKAEGPNGSCLLFCKETYWCRAVTVIMACGCFCTAATEVNGVPETVKAYLALYRKCYLPQSCVILIKNFSASVLFDFGLDTHYACVGAGWGRRCLVHCRMFSSIPVLLYPWGARRPLPLPPQWEQHKGLHIFPSVLVENQYCNGIGSILAGGERSSFLFHDLRNSSTRSFSREHSFLFSWLLFQWLLQGLFCIPITFHSLLSSVMVPLQEEYKDLMLPWLGSSVGQSIILIPGFPAPSQGTFRKQPMNA